MRKHLNKERLLNLIAKFKKAKPLVIGDIILDHYIWGRAERLSPEAPVPVVWANRENYLLGGAGNVAYNLSSLGAKASLAGVIGKDFYGSQLLTLLRKEKIKSESVFVSKDRPTTLKSRVIAQHQQVVRIDWESPEEISLNVSRKIINFVKKNIDNFSSIIIEDYAKGVINPYLLGEIVSLAKKKKKIITVDPKEEHFDYYQEVTALTPNLKEAQYGANFKVKKKEDLNLLGNILREKLNPEALLITLGEEGMRIFLREGGVFHFPTYALEVFDVSGAGDTVIAVFTLALSVGASFLEAGFLANLSAGIVVGKLGVAGVFASELIQRLNSFPKANIQKIA